MASTATPPISTSDLEGLSPETIQELAKLLDRRVTSYTIAFYPIASIVYVVILYLSARLVECFLQRFSPVYRSMTQANKRSSVMYILSIVYTTATLVLQLIAAPSLAKKYTVQRTELIIIAGVFISFLYLFEMIYRESMRLQLLIHHVATLFAICLVAAMLDASRHPSLIVTALVWLFQASTEQFTFIALLMYRLQYPVRRVAWLLKFSAIQNLIPKIGFGVYLLVWWGFNQVQNNDTAMDIAYSVVFFVCLFVLIPTQIYGSWILWQVANGIIKRSKTRDEIGEEGPETIKTGRRVEPRRGSFVDCESSRQSDRATQTLLGLGGESATEDQKIGHVSQIKPEQPTRQDDEMQMKQGSEALQE